MTMDAYYYITSCLSGQIKAAQLGQLTFPLQVAAAADAKYEGASISLACMTGRPSEQRRRHFFQIQFGQLDSDPADRAIARAE